MTNDPYRAPQVDSVVAKPKRKRQRFRWWCFVVNSLVALAVIYGAAGLLLVESRTSSSLPIAPALLFIAGGAVYLIGEWLAYMRGRRSIERLLGIANGFLAFFLGCMSIVVLGTLIALPSSDVFVDVTGIVASVVVATWLGACGWYRLGRTRVVEERQ